MANTHSTLTDLFSSTADAIRDRSGVSDALLADNFPALVGGLKGGIYNQLPYSTDASGAIFNKVGWKTGYRLNSSGNETAESGYEVTGFIPAKMGDVIRLYNTYFKNESYACISFYDSNFNFLRLYNGYGMYTSSILPIETEIISDSDINITKITLSGELNATVAEYIEDTAYIRFSFSMCDSNSVITINDTGVNASPMPIEKMYRRSSLSSNYGGTSDGVTITLNNMFYTSIIFNQSGKTVSVTANDISKTIVTLSSSSYGFTICDIIKINANQFLLTYEYQTDSVYSQSALYCRLFTITEDSLIMSSAITLGNAQAMSGAYTTVYSLDIFELVKDNKNLQEFGILKNIGKYSSANVCSADTIYWNGMYLNGISALSLFSTSWTSLVTCNPSASTANVGYNIQPGFKYGFSYYKETTSGFTGGFAHRIRGRSGAFQNQIFVNANGITDAGAKGDNANFCYYNTDTVSNMKSCTLIGMLNDGTYIGVYPVDNIVAELRIYNYDIYNNIFIKVFSLTLPLNVTSTSSAPSSNPILNNIYYFDNNILGIFINDLCYLYQIIKNNHNSYNLYSIGNVPCEECPKREHKCIEASGIYGNSIKGVGDVVYDAYK